MSQRFLAFTAFAGANLLQSALTHRCLMETIVRKLGAPAGSGVGVACTAFATFAAGSTARLQRNRAQWRASLNPFETTMKPIRVQLSRKRGWRMPANTVKVDRTTRWGNPFDVREYGHELSLRLFEHTARGCWSPANIRDVDEPTASVIYELHCRWLRRIGGHPLQVARAELRGKHLGCWCAPGDGCHADVLLLVANE